MWTAIGYGIVILAVGLIGVGAMAIAERRSGRDSERVKTLEATNDALEREARVVRPGTPDDLARRLRESGGH